MSFIKNVMIIQCKCKQFNREEKRIKIKTRLMIEKEKERGNLLYSELDVCESLDKNGEASWENSM